MKKKTIKEFCGINNVTEYIESLDENTTIISHSVNGMFHYIITETEVIESVEYADWYIKCVNTYNWDEQFTLGHVYPVFKNDDGYYIRDDEGDMSVPPQESLYKLIDELNRYWSSEFKQYKEDTK